MALPRSRRAHVRGPDQPRSGRSGRRRCGFQPDRHGGRGLCGIRFLPRRQRLLPVSRGRDRLQRLVPGAFEDPQGLVLAGRRSARRGPGAGRDLRLRPFGDFRARRPRRRPHRHLAGRRFNAGAGPHGRLGGPAGAVDDRHIADYRAFLGGADAGSRTLHDARPLRGGAGRVLHAGHAVFAGRAPRQDAATDPQEDEDRPPGAQTPCCRFRAQAAPAGSSRTCP